MTFIIAYAETPVDFEPPPKGKSKVVFQLVVGETHMWPKAGVDFGEIGYEGGDAFWENEVSMLDYAIASVASGLDFVPAVGWWVLDEFETHYWKDYYGEVDCDYEAKGIREATWSDYAECWAPPPWWARALLLFGVDATVPRWWRP